MSQILIIDDETDLLEEVGDYLRGVGFSVSAAGDGRHGLSELERTRPDLVVCDVSMPHMSGLDVLTTIRARDDELKNVPFLFLTAHGSLDDEIKGRGIGADDFLTKPIDLQRLAAVIRTRLSQAERFEQQAEVRVREARERVSRTARLRESGLLSIISSLSADIDRFGTAAINIEGLIDPAADPQLTEEITTASAAASSAAKRIRTMMIMASLPTPPINPRSTECDAKAIVKEAGITIGEHFPGGQPVNVTGADKAFADPRSVRAAASGVLSWLFGNFPGSEVAADIYANPCRIAFVITSPYASPDDISNGLNRAIANINNPELQDVTHVAAEDVAHLRACIASISAAIDAAESHGGWLKAKLGDDHVVIELTFPPLLA